MDSESRTLWLGDLETYMDEPYLHSMILGMGISQQLISIKVIKDKQTGLSLKYGFLEFDSHGSAQIFMQENNGKMFPNIPHKYFKIKWATYGGGVKPGSIIPTSTAGVPFSHNLGDLCLCWRARPLNK